MDRRARRRDGRKDFGCKPIGAQPALPRNAQLFVARGLHHDHSRLQSRIADAFAEHGSFWLNHVPATNRGVDGFASIPPACRRPNVRTGGDRADDARARPGRALFRHRRLAVPLSPRPADPRPQPALDLLLGVLGLGMVYLFLPKAAPSRGRLPIDGRMFFLGAAFMLLETRAVVQLALLFGSTWLVNSLVFAAALILILLANLYVLNVPALSSSGITWACC